MVLGGNGPQQTTMSFNNMNDLNSSLGNLLGGFGIRLPQMPPVNQAQNRPPQPTTSSETSQNIPPPRNPTQNTTVQPPRNQF